jgi:3',5'-cyclic AMP phosphodiesterase CpdA
MTDIHLQPERDAVAGYRRAITTVNNLNPEFVITGGDLIYDAVMQDYERANTLYDLYLETTKELHVPVYNTLGNHDLFGIFDREIETTHTAYGKKMYLQRIGKTYYSFDYKGWHFMMLDPFTIKEERHYTNFVDAEQMDWIKSDLRNSNKDTPIVISTHLPFITASKQLEDGPLSAMSKEWVINNAREVLNLFRGYNVQLVLQGHLHILEEIFIAGMHFITGGAVCGKWWTGANNGVEEGYVIVKIKGKEFDWEYFDYGWDVEKTGIEKSEVQ